VGPNYLGGLLDNHARTAIHLAHRIGALVVLLVLSIFVWLLWASQERKARRMALVVFGILMVQLGLGLSNVFWALPLPVAVAHNAVGAMLVLALVTANHRLRTARKTEGENE
jgi:heme a synthase